ncbi:MAG: EAL domain-containing protein [Thermodesulfobacteriota bacterium]
MRSGEKRIGHSMYPHPSQLLEFVLIASVLHLTVSWPATPPPSPLPRDGGFFRCRRRRHTPSPPEPVRCVGEPSAALPPTTADGRVVAGDLPLAGKGGRNIPAPPSRGIMGGSSVSGQLQLAEQQKVLNDLLLLGMAPLSLQEILERGLELIYSLSWLPIQAKGCVFLWRQGPAPAGGELVMCAQRNLEDSLLESCATVPQGRCLCGRAAKERLLVFAERMNAAHVCAAGTVRDHGHYIVPICREEELIGVLNLYLHAGHRRNGTEEEFLRAVANTLAVIIRKKQAEERIAESEARLARNQTIARLGHWIWDIAADRFLLSPQMAAVFGLPAAIASLDDFLERIHADDRERVKQTILQARDGRAAQEIDCRLTGASREFAVHGEVEPCLDPQGKAARIEGIIQDVTFLKKAQNDLLLSAKIFESSIEGITITDAQGKIQFVNRAFTDITGYAAEEVIGENPRLLRSSRHDPVFYQGMWQELLQRGNWQGEIWNRRKNGETYPEWLSITSIKDGRGQVSNYVAVFHDLTAVKRNEAQLRFQAQHDALTGLPNSVLFADRLGVAVGHARGSGGKVAVLFVDLDNFKRVNDSLGYTVGDLLLQECAARIRGCLADEVTVSRQGSDVFLVLVEGIGHAKESTDAARRIIEGLSRPLVVDGHEFHMTASIGITLFPDDARTPGDLIKNAGLALDRAKEAGKNTYELFTRGLNDKVQRRLTLENDLRKALLKQEFLVHYQPRVSLADGRMESVEALVRWQRNDGQLVSPAEFIPLAEETGLILPLGELVLRIACADVRHWRDQGFPLRVSVNLSPRQFHQEGLVGRVAAILAETGLPGSALEFEITEGMVMTNEEKAIGLLGQLREMGIALSVDDFGTGYSSLYYLKRLPIDTLKIDRTFIRDIQENPDDMAIVAATVSMAHRLQLRVVAEGVETLEQLATLCRFGCDQIQGYLFSPAVPAANLFQFLREGRYLSLEGVDCHPAEPAHRTRQ